MLVVPVSVDEEEGTTDGRIADRVAELQHELKFGNIKKCSLYLQRIDHTGTKGCSGIEERIQAAWPAIIIEQQHSWYALCKLPQNNSPLKVSLRATAPLRTTLHAIRLRAFSGGPCDLSGHLVEDDEQDTRG